MIPTPITATVDFDRDGVQHGFLKLPHSRDDSAWGAIMIPITVVRRGAGATALLTGANHGDEYEGPVALVKLAGALQARDVRGRDHRRGSHGHRISAGRCSRHGRA